MNLHDLLEDAVADVEPTDRLTALRARTASPARAARPWWWAAGATVAATAAAVALVAVLDDGPGDPGPTHHHDMATDPPGTTQLVPVYFQGETGSGRSLFREFDRVPAGNPLQKALDRIQQPPSDPDYTTAWKPGTLKSAAFADGTIDVEVGIGDPIPHDPLAVQQVVFTLQAVSGQQWPVRFVQERSWVLGPVSADPTLLNPVSISDPAEGNSYEGSMIARGRALTLNRGVTWRLVDDAGQRVRQGVAFTDAADSLRPWEVEVDLTDVPPGVYTFVVSNDYRIDGIFGTPDTRTIIVR